MRYQQPQGGPLILDASNQLARGAIATTFTPGTPCVGSAPAIIPVYTGGAVYQALGQKGAGAKVANVNGRYISLGTDAQYQSSSFTHLVVAQCNSADFSSSPTILMSNYATNGSVQWRVESTGDLGLVQASQVFIGQSSGKTLAVGTPYCMALASNGGNITRFSIDGGFYGISGTGTSASFNFGNLVLGTKDSTGTERGAWDFYLHIYWPRQLTDTELQTATKNPWALFKTPQRRIYPTSASSPDVTVSVSGLSIASATGTLVPNTSKALTGQSVATATGTLTPALSVAASGQSISTALGTVTPGIDKAATGQSIATALGTVSPSASLVLSGQAIATAQGNVGVVGDVTVSISGLLIGTAQGSVSIGTGSTGVGSYGKSKKKYIVKKDGVLLVFNDQAEAIKALDVKEDVEETKPVETIKLAVVKKQAKAQDKTSEYERLLKLQKYEELIRLYEQMREDEEEDEWLLMAS